MLGLIASELGQGDRREHGAAGACWQPHLTGEVDEIAAGLGRSPVEHHLVQDSGPQGDDPGDGVAAVGDLDGLASRDSP